jgi:hypothetical protein
MGQTNTVIGVGAVVVFFGTVAWMVSNGMKKEDKNERGGTRRKRNKSFRR